MKRSGVWLLLALFLFGCGEEEIAQRYRVERAVWKARRAATRLTVNPDLVGPADFKDVADRFRSAGSRFFDGLKQVGVRPTDPEREVIAHISAQALLSASRYYVLAEESDLALEVAERVRDTMSWSSEASRAAQTRIVEVLRYRDDPSTLARELWRLADDYPAASEEGSEVYNVIFNAPMNAVRIAESSGDSISVQLEVDRALAFYTSIANDWKGRLPALFADLHRASLLDSKGRWRDAASILETALTAYDRDVLKAEEAAQVSFALGRIYLTNRRDVAKAHAYLTDARDAAPASLPAYDASMALAAIEDERGNSARAVSLYREIEQGLERDMVRAPLAKFSLARILERKGNWDEALVEYRGVQKSYPHSMQAMEVPFVVAEHYRETNEPGVAMAALREAEQEYRELIERRAGTAEALVAYRYLFRCLADREDWKASVEAMDAFAAEYQGRPEAAQALLRAAAISSTELSDPERATRLWKRVEETYPNTPFAESAAKAREGS